MKTFKHNIKQAHINALKTKIKEKLTVQNTSDALKLSDEIWNIKREKLSKSTIERFFGFVKTNSLPSQHTLDVLSIFVGFLSWNDFCNSQNTDNFFDNKTHASLGDSTFELFNIVLQNEHYATALEFLEKLEKLNIKLINILGFHIRSTSSARSVLLPELAKFPLGREFYEGFVDIDGLDTYFLHALKQHYVQYLPIDKEKNLRDKIFVASMEYLKHFLNNDFKQLNRTGFKIFNQFTPEEIKVKNAFHPFPVVRFHSYHLHYLHLQGVLTDSYIERVVQYLMEEIEVFHDDQILFTARQLFKILYTIGKYEMLIALYKTYLGSNRLYHFIRNEHYWFCNLLVWKAFEKLGKAVELEDCLAENINAVKQSPSIDIAKETYLGFLSANMYRKILLD